MAALSAANTRRARPAAAVHEVIEQFDPLPEPLLHCLWPGACL